MTKEEFFALGGTQENLNEDNFSIEEFMTNLFDHQELSTLNMDCNWHFNHYCKIQSYQDRCPNKFNDEFQDYIASEFNALSIWEEKIDTRLFGLVDNYFAR